MTSPPEPASREQFAEWVRDALGLMYDSAYLESHALLAALVPPERQTANPAQDLRRVLLAAIRAMHPEPGAPPQGRNWRAYQILELRYVSGASPAEIMKQLALSRSLYFSEQARMLEAVTEHLWRQRVEQPSPRGEEAAALGSAEAELERYTMQATWEAIQVAELLGELRAVIEPLARLHDSRLHLDIAQPFTIRRADRVMLRQVVLGLLGHAFEAAPGGQVSVSTALAEREARIRIQAQAGSGPRLGAAPDRQGLSLEQCRRFLKEMGGDLTLEAASAGLWQTDLTWIRAGRQVVLVIDDNAGMIDLIRRFLLDTEWQVMGATSGAEARLRLREQRPAVIISDVMLPKEDGWEILLALKADSATRDIPVVVCSVLQQPQLVTALGAAAYLPKPVTQQSLLQALRPWSQPGASPSPAR